MKPLLKALEPLEAFRGLMRAEARGEYAGISGAAQICRSHMIAACCAANLVSFYLCFEIFAVGIMIETASNYKCLAFQACSCSFIAFIYIQYA